MMHPLLMASCAARPTSLPTPLPCTLLLPPGGKLLRHQLGRQRTRQLAHHLLAVLCRGDHQAHHTHVLLQATSVPAVDGRRWESAMSRTVG